MEKSELQWAGQLDCTTQNSQKCIYWDICSKEHSRTCSHAIERRCAEMSQKLWEYLGAADSWQNTK